MTNTPTTPTTSALYVGEFMITEAGSCGRPLHFTTDDAEVYPERPPIGGSAGTVVVYVGVDLGHDMVAMDQNRSSQVALLDAAISDLQRVRDTLADLTPTSLEGRCMNGHDWGRCLLPHEHEGACQGPTEAQWQAERKALASVPRRKVAS